MSAVTVHLRASSDDAIVETIQTDAQGEYLFLDIAAGNYFVDVQLPTGASGFTSKDQGADETLDSDVNTADGESDVFSLSTGNPKIDLSAGAVNAPLPVVLNNFSGKENDCDIDLFWKTEVELNFAYFLLERSSNGREFEQIELINSIGANGSDYQFIDIEAKKKNYYRLKMVDLDGTFEYSEVLIIETDCQDRITELALFPNPAGTDFGGIVNIKMFAELDQNSSPENIELIISDQLGREVLKKSVDILDGWNYTQIDIENLGEGIYFVRPNIGRRIIAQKFMIINNN